jgi:hypothetical protein
VCNSLRSVLYALLCFLLSNQDLALARSRSLLLRIAPVVTIKVFHQKLGQRKLGQSVCCHYQSFLIIFVKELEGRIGGKSCKHEKMAPTLTNYENIAVTLCLMSIAILRRRLRDQRVRHEF